MVSEALAYPPFVGREAELERLDGFLARALVGECAICFVTGGAGTGKTAVLTAFARRAQRADPGLVVAIGDCNAQTGAGDPYLPFREILGQLTGDVEGRLAERKMTEENAGRLRRLLRSSAEALVEHGPDLVELVIPAGAILTRLGARVVSRLPWARRLHELAERPLDHGVAIDPGSGLEQSHIFEQFTNVLRALADRHPLVLILDDLHWIDAASAELLFHLGRRLGPHRVLLIGAYRAADLRSRRTEADGGHPLEPVLGELKRLHGDVWIPLDGAEPPGPESAGAARGSGSSAERSVGTARRFLDALVDLQPNRLDESFRESLFRHTEGNPLFTLELLRSLRERGDLVRNEAGRWVEGPDLSWDAMPPRVEAVIGERVRRLGDRLHDLLRIASVEGEEFTAEVVASVSDEPVRAVVAALGGPLSAEHELVWARGVERVAGHSLGLYRFRHSLFQRFFYAQLDTVRRTYLHHDVARALEELYAGDPNAVAVRLALHFERAGETGKAIEYLQRAGDGARRAHANKDALGHYRRALDLLEEVWTADAEDTWVRETRQDLLEGIADVLELGGRHEEALRAYARALAVAEASDEVGPVERARLHRKSAKPSELLRRYEDALEALRRAGSALGDGPAGGEDDEAWWRERIQVSLERIWVHYWLADEEAMERLAGELRTTLGRASPVQKARLFGCELLLRFRKERYRLSEDTEALARHALGAARDVGEARDIANGLFVLGFTLLWRERFEEAEERLAAAIEEARRCGDAVILARALTYLAVVYRRTGRSDLSARIARGALDVSLAGEMGEYVGMAKANLGWAAWRRGERDEAEALTREAIGIWQELGYTYPFKWGGYFTLFAWAVEEDRVEEAARLAGELLGPVQVALSEDLTGALEAGMAAVVEDEPEEAGRRFEQALVLGSNADWV